jgi:hypothetical protein
VKKALLPQISHRALNLVTESARGIISSTEPKLLLRIFYSKVKRDFIEFEKKVIVYEVVKHMINKVMGKNSGENHKIIETKWLA